MPKLALPGRAASGAPPSFGVEPHAAMEIQRADPRLRRIAGLLFG
jgi:hypothetical protein